VFIIRIIFPAPKNQHKGKMKIIVLLNELSSLKQLKTCMIKKCKGIRKKLNYTFIGNYQAFYVIVC